MIKYYMCVIVVKLLVLKYVSLTECVSWWSRNKTSLLYQLLSQTCVIKTNLMHSLSSVYFVNQPVRVSGIFVAHHQEVYCKYTTIGTCCAFQLNCLLAGRPTDSSTEKHNTYQLLYIYSIPPNDGLQICPKHI